MIKKADHLKALELIDLWERGAGHNVEYGRRIGDELSRLVGTLQMDSSIVTRSTVIGPGTPIERGDFVIIQRGLLPTMVVAMHVHNMGDVDYKSPVNPKPFKTNDYYMECWTEAGYDYIKQQIDGVQFLQVCNVES